MSTSPEPTWAKWRDRLSGAWKCTSFNVFDNSGPHKTYLSSPYGPNPCGRLLITLNGWISVHNCNAQRIVSSLPSGKAWAAGEDAEVAYIAKGLTMWCGYLRLFEDEEGGIYWEANVEVAADPTRIGTTETRRTEYFQKDGKEIMVLSTIGGFVMPDGTRPHAVLTWEKFDGL